MLKEIAKKANENNKKVYVYAHKFPDLDAMSSSMATVKYLKSRGVDAKYIVTEEIKNFYKDFLGNIEVTQPNDIDKDQISIVVDTSTVDYAQNTEFKKSTPDNTYVIDHHEGSDPKNGDTKSIEDTLSLPSENVIRNPNSSSACEIIAQDLEKDKELDSDVATTCMLGLLGDTAEYRFPKEETFINTKMLLENGADYQKILDKTTYKIPLDQQVGLAKILLNTRQIKLENGLTVNYLAVSKKQADYLQNKYRLDKVQKKIFKLGCIEDSAVNVFVAENEKSSYDFEFRSTPTYGNVDVASIAKINGGGGHYNASGCNVSSKDDIKDVTVDMLKQVLRLSKEQTKDYAPVELTMQDEELKEILDHTNRFKENITPEILNRAQELCNNKENHYQTLVDKRIPFKQFMLKNEIYSRVPSSQLASKEITINLDENDIRDLMGKYDITEDDMLDQISMFKDDNINFEKATINLNGKSASINSEGKITQNKIKTAEDDPTI